MTQNRPSTQEIAFIPGHPEFEITAWITKEDELLTSVEAVKDYNKQYNNRLNAYDGVIDVDQLLSNYQLIAKPKMEKPLEPVTIKAQLMIAKNLLTVQCAQLQKMAPETATEIMQLGMRKALLELLDTVPLDTQAAIVDGQPTTEKTKIRTLLAKGTFIKASLDTIKHGTLMTYALSTLSSSEATTKFETLIKHLANS